MRLAPIDQRHSRLLAFVPSDHLATARRHAASDESKRSTRRDDLGLALDAFGFLHEPRHPQLLGGANRQPRQLDGTDALTAAKEHQGVVVLGLRKEGGSPRMALCRSAASKRCSASLQRSITVARTPRPADTGPEQIVAQPLHAE
jgi:hypothetical protein